MKNRIVISSSQTLFTFFFLIFFFTLLNGYLQNLVAGYRANEWLVLAGLIVEMALVFWFARRWLEVEIDPLEIAGFVLVVVGVWWYFVIPALPTLLPPTQSSDAVRVYLQVMFTYPNGTLVSWYPAGGAFVVAMFAHWIGIEPLFVLHPIAASILALSAGAVYGITCALLPPTRISKFAALIAPALLFVPWSYFAGTINWEQYFFAQVFAQYFILAAVWFIARYAQQPHPVFAGLIGAALLGVVAAYPIFVVLPLGLFGLVVLAQFFPAFVGRGKGRVESTLTPTLSLEWRGRRSALITLVAFIGTLILAAIALQRGGILEILAGKLSIESDVGAGGVARPSLENLGGPFFLALVVIGIFLAWKNRVGKTILGWLLVWSLQLAALMAIQFVVPVSSYRIDKTFYILVFPFAILAALPCAFVLERVVVRFKISARALTVGFVAAVVLLGAAIGILRPPKPFSPLTESELAVARWAKSFYNETYQIAYLDESPISAYWLALGIWRETLPTEWYQWIPAGRKLGPATFDEWLADPAWHDRMLVRYVDQLPTPVRIVYQIGSSAIIDKDTAPDYGPKPSHRSDLNFERSITLIGYDLPRTTYQPGERLTLTTWTQSLYPPYSSVAWRFEMINSAGQVVSRIERAPFGDKFPLQRWPPGRYARDVWTLPLDASLSPGVYDVQLALFRRTDGELFPIIPMYTTKPWNVAYHAPLARIKIPVAPPTADELRATRSSPARLGDVFALTNYSITPDRALQQIKLALYWRALKSTEKDFTVFVHLIDGSGKIVAQTDAQPRGGNYPTSIWDVGEVVKDEYMLTIPADARAPFSIAVGMYEQPSLQRLPVENSDRVEFKIPDF